MSETRSVHFLLLLADTATKTVDKFHRNGTTILPHVQVDVLTGIAVSDLHAHGVEQIRAIQAQTRLVVQEIPLCPYIDRKDRLRIADTGNHA